MPECDEMDNKEVKDAFFKWMDETYGEWSSIQSQLLTAFDKNNRYFQAWLSAGHPGYEGTALDVIPETPVLAKQQLPTEINGMPVKWGYLGQYEPFEGEVYELYMPTFSLEDVTVPNIPLAMSNIYRKSITGTFDKISDEELLTLKLNDVEFYQDMMKFGIGNALVEQGLPEGALVSPDVEAYIQQQAIMGNRDIKAILAESQKIYQYPEYAQRLKMVGKLPATKEELAKLQYWDEVRAEQLQPLLEGRGGETYLTEKETLQARVNRLTDIAQQTKNKIDQGIINLASSGGPGHQMEVAALESYNLAQQRLSEIAGAESGQLKMGKKGKLVPAFQPGWANTEAEQAQFEEEQRAKLKPNLAWEQLKNKVKARKATI